MCGAQWNPCNPELLAVVLSSGGVYVLEVKEDVKVIASDAKMEACCCEWMSLLPLEKYYDYSPLCFASVLESKGQAAGSRNEGWLHCAV